ncbi:hypothetical protein BC940DRAFT_312116 [Gongronella butleri]|nr:hypothetical protein BC940DRAFT_312116 [Gongronella butleri]
MHPRTVLALLLLVANCRSGAANEEELFPYLTNDYTDYISDGAEYAALLNAMAPAFPYVPPAYQYNPLYDAAMPGAYGAVQDSATMVEPPVANTHHATAATTPSTKVATGGGLSSLTGGAAGSSGVGDIINDVTGLLSL